MNELNNYGINLTDNFKIELKNKFFTILENTDNLLLDLKIFNFVEIKGGADAIIFEFSVLCLRKNSNINMSAILRIFKDFDSNQRSIDEFRILTRLHQTSINVPKPFFIGLNDSALKKPYFVMEKINGILLSKALNTINKDELPIICENVISEVSKLHNLKWKDHLPWLGQNIGKSETKSIIKSELEIAQNLIKQYNISELHTVIEWLKNNQKFVSESNIMPIHGDLNPLNIIIKPDGFITIIDWSNIKLSDYRMDLALLILTTNIESSNNTTIHLTSAYEKINKIKVQNIDYFIILSNINILTMVYSSLADRNYTEASIGLKVFEFKPYINMITEYVYSITGIKLETLRKQN